MELYNFNPWLRDKEVPATLLGRRGRYLTISTLNPQADTSLVLEQFFVNTFNARFFLKTPQKLIWTKL